MNTKESIIDTDRIEKAIQMKYSPFPELTMELLSSQLNAFRIGDLRQAARIWEIMMERDGDLSVPADKLFADIARLPWEIEMVEESREAERHKAALEYFYTNLTATSVLDGDETGGINLLLRQLMTAHAYRYSVHEIILEVHSAGAREVTATFRHCPVWFFEARRGRLAYLRHEFDQEGELLEPGKWLAAVGRGMMRPCSVAYLTKWQPLAYWGLYCYRFGIPGIHGETDAAKDSKEWKDFSAALEAFANDWVTQTNRNAKINLIEASKGGTGTLPFQELVERSDRLYARAFRGGDLSTQSRAGGDVAGSNPQMGEKRLILQDGGQWATDVLNTRVDEPVIAYLFGTQPKAWIRIRPVGSAEEDARLQFTREVYKNMTQHAVVSAVMANLTDLKKVTKDSGLPVNEDYVDPYVPVRDQGGALVSGDVIEDAEGDVIGALPVAGSGGGAAPGGAPPRQMPTAPDNKGEKAVSGDVKIGAAEKEPEDPDEAVLGNESTGPAGETRRLAGAVAAVLRPVLAAYDERLQRILTITEPELRAKRWAELQSEMATMERDHLTEPTELVRALESINARAFAAGLQEPSALENYDPSQSRDSLGKWVDDNGGGLSEHDNLVRGGNAMDRAIRQRADVQKAMYRKEVGQIDFKWGTPGQKSTDRDGKTWTGGEGISHVTAKHGEAAARQIPVVIANGRIIPHDSDPATKRYVIYQDKLVVLRKRNSRNAYTVTGYDDPVKIAKLEKERRPSWMTGEIEGR